MHTHTRSITCKLYIHIRVFFFVQRKGLSLKVSSRPQSACPTRAWRTWSWFACFTISWLMEYSTRSRGSWMGSTCPLSCWRTRKVLHPMLWQRKVSADSKLWVSLILPAMCERVWALAELCGVWGTNKHYDNVNIIFIMPICLRF